nr:hypothetical protein [Mucilaginibacter sp. L294]
MADEVVLQGKVMWSYDYEMVEFTSAQKLMTGLSGIGGPLHNHQGYIALTGEQVLIEGQEGDEALIIPLASMNELYLGYDDVFTASSVKNGGLFWQPLRLEYLSNNYQTTKVYLIIDYNGLYSHNKRWYETLTAMLQ